MVSFELVGETYLAGNVETLSSHWEKNCSSVIPKISFKVTADLHVKNKTILH